MRTSTDSNARGTAARRRAALAITVMCLVVGWCGAAGARESITASEAAKHVGESATVCGSVASAKYVAGSKGQPTFLNIDKAYPDQVFTVVVWGDDRGRFPSPPEVAFEGKNICVTGQIETYKGKAQIVVHDPKQIVEEK